MAKKPAKKLDGVSDKAVQKATGHVWSEWFAILDKSGAKKWDHREIVAYLKDNYELTDWWQQSVTVAYEKSTGRRAVGQTADTGFQVGVQKALPIDLGQTWSLLASHRGIALWLGKVSRLSLTEGKTCETACGIKGEIRVVKPGNRVRLTWHRPDMKRPATLQIALVGNGEKTSLRVHLEHLPSQKVREEMNSHWRGVLNGLANLAEE